MTKKRVFIAINLPEQVREALEKEIADLALRVPESVRFTPPDSLHFTLTFLGYQTDERLGEIVAVLRDVVPRFASPEIAITHIAYGPPSPRQSGSREGWVGAPARMIWAVTDEKTSEALGEIKEALEDALAGRGVQFEHESRKYNAHLTLARFERVDNLPTIDAPLVIRFMPEGVDLMESTLKKSGVEYTLLTEVEFGEELG